MPTVAVFAGSKTPNDPAIIEAATALGTKLAKAGYEITYGGGDQGVMGAVAKAALAAGGKVTALVLDLYKDEKQLPGAQTIYVHDEQERFRNLTHHNNPVAFFALPGSAGTMREVLQTMEMSVYEGGPGVVIVKVGTYLDGLKEAFEHSVAAGLTKADKAGNLVLWNVEDDLAPAISGVKAPPKPVKPAVSP